MRIWEIRSFGDVVKRFRENWQGYAGQYRLLLILLILASLADMATTMCFMLALGPGAESHPAIRSFAQVLGPILGPLFGKAVQFFVAIGLTVFLRRWAAYILVVLIVLYSWAAWYNIWGYHTYHPMLLHLLDRLGI